MQIFWDYNNNDFGNVFKIVLAFYILFGTLVLKLLFKQKERFMRNDKVILMTFIFFLILFVGTREIYIGTDTGNYYNFFYIPVTTQVSNYFEVFTRLKSDFLFEVIVSFSFWHQN